MVKIVPNYYDTLPPYMETIFSLTKHAIEKDEEEVAKQAIEFWSSVCEEEIDLIDVRGRFVLLVVLLPCTVTDNALTPALHSEDKRCTVLSLIASISDMAKSGSRAV